MLAQIPPASPEQLGAGWITIAAVLGTIASLMVIAAAVKAIFFPQRPEKDATATHSDLATIKSELLASINGTKNELALKMDQMAPRDRLIAVETRLGSVEDGHTELRKYTRDSVHDIKDVLQAIQLSLTELKVLFRTRGAGISEREREQRNESEQP